MSKTSAKITLNIYLPTLPKELSIKGRFWIFKINKDLFRIFMIRYKIQQTTKDFWGNPSFKLRKPPKTQPLLSMKNNIKYYVSNTGYIKVHLKYLLEKNSFQTLSPNPPKKRTWKSSPTSPPPQQKKWPKNQPQNCPRWKSAVSGTGASRNSMRAALATAKALATGPGTGAAASAAYERSWHEITLQETRKHGIPPNVNTGFIV